MGLLRRVAALGACLFAVLVATPSSSLALDVPSFSDRVMDLAGVFDPNERQDLSRSLGQFQAEVGPQIVVLTIPTLEGESIEGYSIKVADAWRIGDAKRDDGVLLLFAKGDRKVRIEVGQGLEGTLPDILAGRIIRDVMIPYFKEGRYDAGIVAGLQAVAGRLGGTLKDVPSYARSPRSQGRGVAHRLGPFELVLVLFFVFFVVVMIIGGVIFDRLFGSRMRSYSRHRPGGFWDDHRSGWGGGGFGGGFGGGGFGGGGGGGFSGGGASGNW